MIMDIQKKIFGLLLFFLIPFIGMAQQLPQFSQYMFNTVSINPAYAGSREKLNVTFLNRNQWVGINGAPITQTLTTHSPIPNTNVGVGLSIINDKLGYENTTYIYGDVSYQIEINKDYRFSFGLKAGLSRYGLDPDLLMDQSAISDQYLDRIFNSWKPNFGVGFYLRSDDLFVGLSSPRIVSYTNETDITYEAIERASYYLTGGYMLEFNPQLKFKPTALIKYTNGAPVSVDLTANFLIKEKLWLGAAYRFDDAAGGYVTVLATDALRIGYSYEFSVSNIRPYTSGSHEIFISYEFELPKSRCNCANKF